MAINFKIEKSSLVNSSLNSSLTLPGNSNTNIVDVADLFYNRQIDDGDIEIPYIENDYFEPSTNGPYYTYSKSNMGSSLGFNSTQLASYTFITSSGYKVKKDDGSEVNLIDNWLLKDNLATFGIHQEFTYENDNIIEIKYNKSANSITIGSFYTILNKNAIIIVLIGAGGGGGGAKAGENGGGGGGGSGAIVALRLNLFEHPHYGFKIGAGGSGNSGDTDGNSGGNTVLYSYDASNNITTVATAGGGGGGGKGSTQTAGAGGKATISTTNASQRYIIKSADGYQGGRGGGPIGGNWAMQGYPQATTSDELPDALSGLQITSETGKIYYSHLSTDKKIQGGFTTSAVLNGGGGGGSHYGYNEDNSYYRSGGAGGTSNDGYAGTTYGAGGGGAHDATYFSGPTTGGNGKDGIVIIYY